AEPFKQRLKEVLALVMAAMGAQSAALMLYDPHTSQLELAASAGAGAEALEKFGSLVDISSFSRAAAATAQSTELLHAAMTELVPSESLRQSGIQSLLGVRLSP